MQKVCAQLNVGAKMSILLKILLQSVVLTTHETFVWYVTGASNGKEVSRDLKMNTAYGDLISQYASICVPSIEYLAGM